MTEEKEFSKQRKYYTELKLVKSEIVEILEERDENRIARAAKYYPVRINQMLMKRNIISATVLFPFLDLALLKRRKQEIELIDLNAPKNDISLLRETILRIDREFEME